MTFDPYAQPGSLLHEKPADIRYPVATDISSSSSGTGWYYSTDLGIYVWGERDPLTGEFTYYATPNDTVPLDPAPTTITNEPPNSTVADRFMDVSGAAVVNLAYLLAIEAVAGIYSVDIDIIQTDADGMPLVTGSATANLSVTGESVTIEGIEDDGVYFPCSDFTATLTAGDIVRFSYKVIL